MNYEKAYKEALERAKSKIENDKGHVLYEDDIKEIFPELAESEGERIRKNTISIIENSMNGVDVALPLSIYKECIAWLEKQGEKDSQVILPTFTFDDILALQCCMQAMSKNDELYKKLQSIHDRLHEVYGLEKQGEQKPSWNENDEKNLNTIINVIHGGTHLAYENEIDWLKSIKDRVQPQPKQEWSEEDKKMWAQVINEIEAIKSNSSTIFEKNIAQNKIDWLKSLKCRINGE